MFIKIDNLPFHILSFFHLGPWYLIHSPIFQNLSTFQFLMSKLVHRNKARNNVDCVMNFALDVLLLKSSIIIIIITDSGTTKGTYIWWLHERNNSSYHQYWRQTYLLPVWLESNFHQTLWLQVHQHCLDLIKSLFGI